MNKFNQLSNDCLNCLRSILPKPLKQLLKKLFGMPPRRLHSDWKILEIITSIDDKHTVLDIGARNGWFFQCWRDYCPNVTVYAFEPDIDAYKRLINIYGDNNSIHLSQFGVGDKESIETFYHMQDSEVSSSFLQHEPELWNEIQYETGSIGTRLLEMTTLDRYVEDESIEEIFLIKIDIQGYELKALQGANMTLKKVSYILVESAIQPLYKGAATFGQVHDYLVKNNFHLVNFRAWHRGNNKLMETDMLFRHNNLLPCVGDSGIDREYIGDA